MPFEKTSTQNISTLPVPRKNSDDPRKNSAEELASTPHRLRNDDFSLCVVWVHGNTSQQTASPGSGPRFLKSKGCHRGSSAEDSADKQMAKSLVLGGGVIFVLEPVPQAVTWRTSGDPNLRFPFTRGNLRATSDYQHRGSSAEDTLKARGRTPRKN